MMTAAPADDRYVVEVDIAAGCCTWSVVRDDAPVMAGPAPDARSARRRGLFAAGALGALARIARRRF